MDNLKVTMMALMIGMAGVVWAGPVNVNTADAKTLAEELEGVGENLAAAVVEERARGPFKVASACFLVERMNTQSSNMVLDSIGGLVQAALKLRVRSASAGRVL